MYRILYIYYLYKKLKYYFSTSKINKYFKDNNIKIKRYLTLNDLLNLL